MHRRFAILVVILGLVAACGGGATPTPAPTEAQTPAPTDIFAPTEEPAASEAPGTTEAPAATPASGKRYTVKKADNMWTIAQKFGIRLADLRAANPDVDPRAMRVGTVLVIPAP
jgi:LysM repeat protein